MKTREIVQLSTSLYKKALEGKRILITGDSFFIAVIEKHLISRLADASTADISLATYKPALNAHFFSGGQIMVVDFFDGLRGVNQLQYLDDLDELYSLESQEGSFRVMFEEHVAPIDVMFDKFTHCTMEI